jgi:hypothetical protein
MAPLNWLDHNCNSSKTVKSPIEEGMDPANVLFPNHNPVRAVMNPNDDGMVPVNLFACKFKDVMSVNSPKSSGIWPRTFFSFNNKEVTRPSSSQTTSNHLHSSMLVVHVSLWSSVPNGVGVWRNHTVPKAYRWRIACLSSTFVLMSSSMSHFTAFSSALLLLGYIKVRPESVMLLI